MATLCINISHPRFTYLKRQTGLPEGFLKARAAAWAEENDTETIPTAQELGLEVKYDSEIYPYSEDDIQVSYTDLPEYGESSEPFFFTELEAPGQSKNSYNTVVNFDLNKIRSASGKLGEQGATVDGIRDLLKYVGVD